MPVSSKYRSGLEDKVIADLKSKKVSFSYESITITYIKKPSKYKPDIILDNGIIVEVKGYFRATDRAKHLLIKEQHPELDIRFVFQDSKKKIHKSSSTTYGDWAHDYGFIYADKVIPDDWINEPKRRLEHNKQVRPSRRPKLGSTTGKNTAKGT